MVGMFLFQGQTVRFREDIDNDDSFVFSEVEDFYEFFSHQGPDLVLSKDVL